MVPFRPMPSTRASRAQTWLLLIALIGGGLGLPLLDALLFHSRPAPALCQGDWLSRTGPAGAHNRACALDHATRSGNRALPSAPAQATPKAQILAAVLPPLQVHPRRNWLAAIQSRAPPLFRS
jgi:hypothetical protein